jgi:DNA-binding transcriptional LysR family regulator
MPIARSHRDRFPNVTPKIETTDDPVDIHETGYDVGIVLDHMIRSENAVTRPIAALNRKVVASPGYLEPRGMPKTLEDLRDHSVVSLIDGPMRRTRDFIIDDAESGSHLELKPALRRRAFLYYTAPRAQIWGSPCYRMH